MNAITDLKTDLGVGLLDPSLALFPLGIVFVDADVIDLCEQGEEPDLFLVALQRHALGDWGDVSEAGTKENDQALKHGFRLFSFYAIDGGLGLSVTTEWDRSFTLVQLIDIVDKLPEEE